MSLTGPDGLLKRPRAVEVALMVELEAVDMVTPISAMISWASVLTDLAETAADHDGYGAHGAVMFQVLSAAQTFGELNDAPPAPSLSHTSALICRRYEPR